jgi:tetratricopeptide (TPR) repeat protein
MRTIHKGLRSIIPTLAAAALVGVPAFGNPTLQPTAGASFGHLDFPITGSRECQRMFRQGMLELHSFQYDQAHASFGAALNKDPGCAMAAWGDAMAYEHPVWLQRDVQKSRAALARITNESRLTPKERAYLSVARSLFSVEDRRTALKAWLAAAAKMHADYPNDDEAALQHALVRIAVFDEENDQREMLKGGVIALDVMEHRPNHPGAAHYVIHAFDTNDHAILALKAARKYAQIAPASAHAVHMPSHTFTQLGMWSDVVPSNVRAFAISQEGARKLQRGPDHWDWHAYSWLVAAHLELGQRNRARQLLEDAKAVLVSHDSPDLRDAYADVSTNYLVQTGRWEEAETLVAPLLKLVPSEGPAGSGPIACAEHAPGGGAAERLPYALLARVGAHRALAEVALRSGNAVAAAARTKDLLAVLDQMKLWPSVDRSGRVRAYAAELEARAKLLRTPSPEGEQEVIRAIQHSADLSNKVIVGGPAFFSPPDERLADTLLAMGRPAEALVQYERSLRSRPNRALSLLGSARSARAAGDADKARNYYATLAALWKDADADLPALAEVRAGGRDGHSAESVGSNHLLAQDAVRR